MKALQWKNLRVPRMNMAKKKNYFFSMLTRYVGAQELFSLSFFSSAAAFVSLLIVAQLDHAGAVFVLLASASPG